MVYIVNRDYYCLLLHSGVEVVIYPLAYLSCCMQQKVNLMITLMLKLSAFISVTRVDDWAKT